MGDDSIHTVQTFSKASARPDEELEPDNLLRLSSNLLSLVAGIQAIAREREDDTTFAHIVNLADITSEHLDHLHNRIDRLQWSLDRASNEPREN